MHCGGVNRTELPYDTLRNVFVLREEGSRGEFLCFLYGGFPWLNKRENMNPEYDATCPDHVCNFSLVLCSALLGQTSVVWEKQTIPILS